MVRIWNANTGEQESILEGHIGIINSIALDQSGTRIVTASKDGTSRIFYVYQADLLVKACERAVRNMNETEWKQYMDNEPLRPTCQDKPILAPFD